MELRTPVLIRLPVDLKERLVELARIERRSLNQQITMLLEKSPKS